MPVTKEYDETCTCGEPTGDMGHDGNCQLWNQPDWVEGIAVWHEGELHNAEALWGWDSESIVEVNLPTNTDDVQCMRCGVELFGDHALDLGVCDDCEDAKEDDDLYECTCYQPGDLSVTRTSAHAMDCELREHDAWMDGICDWDHPTRTFVYQAELVTDAKLGPSSLWDDADYLGGYGSFGGISTCNHDGTKAIEFPDGTLVYPSSSHGVAKHDSDPDFALYLETSRTPYCASSYIPWRDYGLPQIPFHTAAAMIADAFSMARDGLTVEVGCIGAHGRTGTVLACMAVLAGVDVDDAVEYVRAHHCKKAVENERQQWFVQWFNAWYLGIEAPPTPPVKPTPTKEKFEAKTYDFEIGSPCPYCKDPLVNIEGQGLACNRQKCQGWKGLDRCPECKCYLDAQKLEGYRCWNMHCTLYNTKAETPPKKLFGKGRK